MALSAKPGKGNGGQTDQGRGSIATMPKAKPRGRVESRGGKAGSKPNDNTAEGLSRRGGAINGAV